MNEPIIVLDGLTKSYGKHRGIKNISFSVTQGEIFWGGIGPNGAGKSTTIRTLMGLLKPTDGKASIFGLDCGQCAAEIAKDVGYLPSENCYHNNLKVREMLQYTADLYDADCRSRMEELAERLNLDLSRRIGDLSLGNKKKVGIVSALLPTPKLLILDEPTNGLDPLVQQTFNQILWEENEKGTTIFLSSHVLSEIQKLCDRVAILREGKLIGLQSMKELRENGYKRISISTKEPITKDFFAIPGVADLKQEHLSASFIFNGNAMTIMNRRDCDMVVFQYEWKRNRKYILIWAAVLAVCIFGMTPVYYGMIETPETLSETFTQGGFFETVGVSLALLMEPLGMYSFLNAFFMIAGGIFGMHLGLALQTKECTEHTAEYLFTKPCGRKKIYGSKTLCLLIGIGIAGTAYVLASFFTLTLFEPGFALEEFLLLAISFILITLFFGALGLFWGNFRPNNRLPLLTAGLSVFVAYCITAFSRTIGNHVISFLSPFSFFNPSVIHEKRYYEWDYLIWYLLLITFFFLFSYKRLLKRDIVS